MLGSWTPTNVNEIYVDSGLNLFVVKSGESVLRAFPKGEVFKRKRLTLERGASVDAAFSSISLNIPRNRVKDDRAKWFGCLES